MAKSPAGAVTHSLPAACPSGRPSSTATEGTEDCEVVRPESPCVLSAARAALVEAGEEVHASREAQGLRAAVAARLGKS